MDSVKSWSYHGRALAAFKDAGEWIYCREIARRAGLTRRAAGDAVKKLFKAGWLVRQGRRPFLYALASKQPPIRGGKAQQKGCHPGRPVGERFWLSIKRDGEGGCWIWEGAKLKNGYGRLKFNGGFRMAHRFAYEFLVAPIPKGMAIDHLCCRPLCVNPAHLDVVTRGENTKRHHARLKLQAELNHKGPSSMALAPETISYLQSQLGERT